MDKINKIPHAVFCLNCRTILVSQHRHDFLTCLCKDQDKQIGIDGGHDYQKMTFNSRSRWIDTNHQEYEGGGLVK